MNWLEPFRYGFMVDAILIGSLVATVCAVLSCFLVLKGWSLMGDAISHAVLPGIVGAHLLGLPLAVGAFVAGWVCAASVGWIKANSRIKEDTVMGIIFTGLFALGLVLFTKVQTDTHLLHILFGNILGIEPESKVQTLVAAGVTLTVVLLMRKDLLLFCFDPSHARAIGLNTTMLYYVLLSLLAGAIVASLQAVGILLVVAMLVTPGCIGYLLTDRFNWMLVAAVASSVFSCVAGVYISFFLNGATGPCIVLAQAACFAVVFVIAPKHGLLATRRQRASARREGTAISRG